MKHSLAFVLLLTLCSRQALTDEQAHQLEVVATAANVSIVAIEGDRRSVQLPELGFSLQLTYRCASSYAAKSLSLTIADDHRYFVEDDLDSESGMRRVEIDVEAGQIAPVVVNGYCDVSETDAPDDQHSTPLTLPSLLSAHASLRCENAASQESIYRIVPLDVVLSCEPVSIDKAEEQS